MFEIFDLMCHCFCSLKARILNREISRKKTGQEKSGPVVAIDKSTYSNPDVKYWFPEESKCQPLAVLNVTKL